ncbi:MAG: COP23 domain-containing protein [Hormoscilla sp.]
MKIRSLLSGAVMLVMGAAMHLPSYAEGTRRADGEFFCSSNNGVPATVVKHPDRGEVVFIRWTSDYFEGSGWTPQRRCEAVSARFQSAQSQGILTYIVSSRMNGYGVICASRSADGPCEEMLLTLKPWANPSDVIQQVVNVNTDRTAPALAQTGNGLLRNSRGEQVLHVDTFIGVTRNNVGGPSENIGSCTQTLWGPCK